MLNKTCQYCGISFVAPQQKRKFCSRHCAAKFQAQTPAFAARLQKLHADPEWKRKTSEGSREALTRTRQTPNYQANLQAYLASERNPFNNPMTHEKALLVNRERGYQHLNGGNGRGPTIPQALLAARLGWTMEYAIGVKPQQAGYPRNYKVDIANVVLRIAIEIDGEGHKGAKARQRDAKKTDCLTQMGWHVRRYTNQQVLTNTDWVVNDILEAVKSLTLRPAPAIISQKDC